MNDILKDSTKDMCYHASKDVIFELTKNDSHLFKHIVMLSTENISDNSWMKNMASEQFFHSYFLAQDADGVWYAGSPANHKQKDNDYALTILKDTDLDKLIKRMEERDGSEFPDARTISYKLNIDNYAFPEINGRKFNFLEIRKVDDGFEFNRHNYSV